MQINEIRGTPWEPVPKRNSINIPTNMEETGEVLNDEGNVESEGYEEDTHENQKYKTDVDKTQDEYQQKKEE